MLFNEFYNEENYTKLDDVLKTFKDEGELVKSDIWDKLAFGIVPGEQYVNVKDLKVKYPIDYDNAVVALKKDDYFKDDFDSLPPIEVKYQKGKLYIEDGYHRYVYAKKHKIDKIKADVSIMDNPYDKLGVDLNLLVKRFKNIKRK